MKCIFVHSFNFKWITKLEQLHYVISVSITQMEHLTGTELCHKCNEMQFQIFAGANSKLWLCTKVCETNKNKKQRNQKRNNSVFLCFQLLTSTIKLKQQVLKCKGAKKFLLYSSKTATRTIK